MTTHIVHGLAVSFQQHGIDEVFFSDDCISRLSRCGVNAIEKQDWNMIKLSQDLRKPKRGSQPVDKR